MVKQVAVRVGIVGILIAAMSLISGCSYSRMSPASSLTPANSAQFGPPVGVILSSGSTIGQEVSGGEPFWWINQSSAELTVFNNSKASTAAVVFATVRPPPCQTAVTVMFTPPTGAVISVTADSNGADLSLPLNVAAEQSSKVVVSVTGPGCRVANDPRTFYAGLFNLRT